MDDVKQLGEMLRHYADSEAHKKQQHEAQSAVWAAQIEALYGQIEQWLAPVMAPNLLELSREAYVAHGQIGRAHAELQSLMRTSYAVFCLKKKTQQYQETTHR